MLPSSQLKPELASDEPLVNPAASTSESVAHQSRNESSVQTEGLRITSLSVSRRWKSSCPRIRSLIAAVFESPSRTCAGPIRVDWPNRPSPSRPDHEAPLHER